MASESSTEGIQHLAFQSRSIPFSEWISLVTLCLAPLIAHLVAGVPRPSYLIDATEATNNGNSMMPRWHDLLPLYNPTTIFWRYAAITHRRIRTPRRHHPHHPGWDARVSAASNAIFWTLPPPSSHDSHSSTSVPPSESPLPRPGWDGSESMIARSMPFCTRLPPIRNRGSSWLPSFESLFSWEMHSTIVTTLQGAQALYIVLRGFTDASQFQGVIALDKIFVPLSVLGLVRLVAATWLTGEYTFAAVPVHGVLDRRSSREEEEKRSSLGGISGNGGVVGGEDDLSIRAVVERHGGDVGGEGEEEKKSKKRCQNITTTTTRVPTGASLITTPSYPPLPEGGTIVLSNITAADGNGSTTNISSSYPLFFPPTIWSARLFAAAYLLPLTGILAVCVLYIAPWPLLWPLWNPTPTVFLMNVFYTAFMGPSLIIYAYYFFFSSLGATSTIIPCVGQTWYKIYTAFILLLVAGLIVVAGVETKETPCGRYTSYHGGFGDWSACDSGEEDILRLRPSSSFSSSSSSSDHFHHFHPDEFVAGFGIATWQPLSEDEPGHVVRNHHDDANGEEKNKTAPSSSSSSEFLVYNFTGACMGSLSLTEAPWRVVVPSSSSSSGVSVR